MSKYLVMHTVVKEIDGKHVVTIEPVTCQEGNGHLYEHVMRTGLRKGLPKMYERCVCGSEYWGPTDERIFQEAKAAGNVTIKEHE